MVYWYINLISREEFTEPIIRMKRLDNALRKGFAKSAEKFNSIVKCDISVTTWRVIYITTILSVIAAVVVVIVVVFVPKPNSNSNWNIGSPTFSPTKSNVLQFGYFHNSGNQVVDSYGTTYRISAVNW